MWLLTMAVYPEEHRGVPEVASGSWVLQSPNSKGFVVLSVSVPPGAGPRSSTGWGERWVTVGIVPSCG